METMPLVSVALCSFNGERYLPAQLDSILAQSYPRLEVVAVDDDSTDATANVLETYARQDPRIRWYQNPQRIGFHRNFEKAISLCTGEFIALADQDDIWHPEKLERLLRHMHDHFLVYHDSELIDADGMPLGKRMSECGRFVRGKQPLSFILGNCVSGHALMFRRELVPHLLPFPTCFFNDEWLALIASSLGTIDYVDACLVQHRKHASSATQQLAEERSRHIPPYRSGRDRAKHLVVAQQSIHERIVTYARHPDRHDPSTVDRLLRLHQRYMSSYFSPGLALFLIANPDIFFFHSAQSSMPLLARIRWAVRHAQGMRLRALTRRLDLKTFLGFKEKR